MDGFEQIQTKFWHEDDDYCELQKNAKKIIRNLKSLESIFIKWKKKHLEEWKGIKEEEEYVIIHNFE